MHSAHRLLNKIGVADLALKGPYWKIRGADQGFANRHAKCDAIRNLDRFGPIVLGRGHPFICRWGGRVSS